MPVAAYNVSGEYAMLKAAAAAGYLDERAAVLETLTGDPARRRRHRHHLPRQGCGRMAPVARPKLRSRKDGAAVPLDDARQPPAQPHAGAASRSTRGPTSTSPREAGIDEDEALQRVAAAARRPDHPPGHPDLRHPRARATRSMLVAAKVDPEHPWRRGQDHQRPPGVSHNYLRNHDFNIWFTIAIEPDSMLGLERTLEVLGASRAPSRSASCRRSSCSRSAWTWRWRATPRRWPPRPRRSSPPRPSPSPTTSATWRSSARSRATCRSCPSPTRPPASELGMDQADLLAHLEGMVERRLLRRVAAILFHRRAGFSANGMGVWKVPDDRIAGDRQADGRLPRHLALLPAPHLPRLALLASSPWLTVAPRRSATRSSTRSREDTGIDRAGDAVLVDRVQEGPAALLHGRLQGLGARARVPERGRRLDGGLPHRRPVGRALPPRPRVPPGRRQLARCGRCARSGATRCSSTAAQGAELMDVDGNRYVDWVCSWGPLIHGHAASGDRRGGRRAAARGTSFGAPTAGEVALAEEVADAHARRWRCCA